MKHYSTDRTIPWIVGSLLFITFVQFCNACTFWADYWQENGQYFLQTGNMNEALNAFYFASDIDPDCVNACLRLAYVAENTGNPIIAKEYYIHSLKIQPDNAAICVQLADLCGRFPFLEISPDEPVTWLEHALKIHPNWKSVILRLARHFLTMNKLHLAERYFDEYTAELSRCSSEGILESADFYLRFGDLRHARELYSYLLQQDDMNGFNDLIKLKIMKIDVEEEAFKKPFLPNRISSSEVRRTIQNGRIALSQLKKNKAYALFKQAISIAPEYPDGYIALGDYYVYVGQPEKAEDLYLKSISVDPNNAEAYIQLGRLYLDYFGGKKSEQAAACFSEAYKLRPEMAELLFFKARSEAEAGRFESATADYQRYINTNPSGLYVNEAQNAIRNLNRSFNSETTSVFPSTSNFKTGFYPLELQHRYGIVIGFMERGRNDLALKELNILLEHHPRPELYTLQARLYFLLNDEDNALTALENALSLESDQPEVLEQCGLIYMHKKQFKEAEPYLLRAAQTGQSEAWFHLAQCRLKLRRYSGAFSALNRYLDETPYGIYRNSALSLRKKIIRNFTAIVVPIIVLIFIIVGYQTHAHQKKARQITLDRFLKLHPESYHDIANTLLAIQHDLLKHNTFFLENTIHALSENKSDCQDTLQYLLNRLTGYNQSKGIIDQFAGFKKMIQRLVQKYGYTYEIDNDPDLNDISIGFKSLARLIPRLKRTLSSNKDIDLEKLILHLRHISDRLNKKGYRNISVLLKHSLKTELNVHIFERIFTQVSHEPEFFRVTFPQPEIYFQMETPILIPIPMLHLEEILVNLIRNALESSIRSGIPSPLIRFEVQKRYDSVTFVERIAIRIMDQSSEKLDLELQLNKTSGGLKLVKNLLHQYGGALIVEKADHPWEKAVTLLFESRTITGEIIS